MSIQALTCLAFALGSLSMLAPTATAQNTVPPFVAEARLLTEGFRPGPDTHVVYKSAADVIFVYSNGWWQVEARYKYLHRDTGFIIENCMKIPDGTRAYVLFESTTNQGLATMAYACPRSIPTPGRKELLVPWLALCPHPELPLIDGKRMRRFINLIDDRPKIFNAPQNEALYEVKYLAPENAFLSELVVTNNGFSLELNVMNHPLEDEGEIRRYGPPFENGYTELRYQMLESTNLSGLKFPLRAVYRTFWPNWGGKDRNDLRLGLQSDLTVTRISFSEQDRIGRFSSPTMMIADDTRAGVTISYAIQDSQWKPLTDPEIRRRVRIARQSQNSSE